MHNQTAEVMGVPVLINVKPDFTGFVVVSLESGTEKTQFPLRENEFFGSVGDFIEIARSAGYQVIPPAA